MLDVEPSQVGQLADRLRRLSTRVERKRDKELLFAAAYRITELETRVGLRHYQKIKFDVEGKHITFAQAVELYGAEGVSVDTASARYHGRGWSLIEAISTPVHKSKGATRVVKRVSTLTLRSSRLDLSKKV